MKRYFLPLLLSLGFIGFFGFFQKDIQTFQEILKIFTQEESQTQEDFSKVIRVVDGDTFIVDIDGVEEKVRILGIDTPETVHPSNPVECFGKEASNRLKNFVEGKIVILVQDPASSDRDRYGRLLRYVEIDEEDIGAKMIQEGYAFSYKSFPHTRLEYYNQSERQARENEQGLWNKNICDYTLK